MYVPFLSLNQKYPLGFNAFEYAPAATQVISLNGRGMHAQNPLNIYTFKKCKELLKQKINLNLY